MKNFLGVYDIPRKLIAVLMAIALWIIVVVNNESVMRQYTYSNIPITYINQDILADEYGLSIIEGNNQAVNVRVRGPYVTLNALRPSDIQVIVDVSKFKNPGTYTINTSDNSADYLLRISSNDTQNITNKLISSPASFQIVVDKIVSKRVPVSVHIMGSPPDGYLYLDPEPQQREVTVVGPKSTINEIKKAIAVVPKEDSQGLTKTTNVLTAFTFLDANGEPVDATHVTQEPNEMNITIPVYAVAKLPLTVELVGSDTLAVDSVKANIEPEGILVYGSENVISKLTEISLGQLQLGTINLEEPTTIPIQLPDGITRVSGEAVSAKVTVVPVGMSTREIPVTNIMLNNIGTNPNLTAALRTNSITLSIQADTAALTNVTADNLNVTAVFNADELGPGIHEVPIDVKSALLDQTGFTVLNPDVKVTIEIKSTADANETMTEGS